MFIVAGVLDIALTLFVYQFNVPVALCFSALGVLLVVGTLLEIWASAVNQPQGDLRRPEVAMPVPKPVRVLGPKPVVLPLSVADMDAYRARHGRPEWPGRERA